MPAWNATFSYHWVRGDSANETDISGATGSAYTLVNDDLGKTIKVRVSFTDDDGCAETLTSAATGEIQQPPNVSATGLPTIQEDGTIRPVGQIWDEDQEQPPQTGRKLPKGQTTEAQPDQDHPTPSGLRFSGETYPRDVQVLSPLGSVFREHDAGITMPEPELGELRDSLRRRGNPGKVDSGQVRLRHGVADTEPGEDVGRVVGIVAQLAADGADGGAHGPHVGVAIRAPHPSQQVLVGEHPPRVGR